ncbi:MAG: DUF5320 domain-containing protein [Elusimicrobiota bacterium]
MPFGDGTGPFGTGPVGRGLGPCGKGRSWRIGGWGRGFGYGRGYGRYIETSDAEVLNQEIEVLKARIKELENLRNRVNRNDNEEGK